MTETALARELARIQSVLEPIQPAETGSRLRPTRKRAATTDGPVVDGIVLRKLALAEVRDREPDHREHYRTR